MDNQNLRANRDYVFMSQNKILQAEENSVFKPQNKKILQGSMENSDTNLSKVFICHRLPERTFKIRNHYFPVCSRCMRIYVGAASYYIFVYFVYVQYSITIILVDFLRTLPTFSDGLTQFWSGKSGLLQKLA